MRKNLIGLVMASAIALASPAMDAGATETGFTFKRVKPPSGGSGKRINIQIEPTAPAERVLSHKPDLPGAPSVATVRRAPSSKGTHEWFWAEISPSLSEASFRRLELAAAAMQTRPEAAGLAPSRDRLAAIVDRFGPQILTATAGTQVSPALVLSVISVESAGNSTAKSHAGAVGLMQLMPATAKRFGVTDRTNAMDNILGGVKYLDFLLDEFSGDAVLALAAYNAGEGAVQRNGGVPEYAETRAYVPKVVAAWQHARLMCLQPPVKATDGCLFTGMRIASQ